MAGFEIVDFAVEGAGEFPIDMLRYDSCWPKSSEDAESIGRNHGRISDQDGMGRRVVQLQTYSYRRVTLHSVTPARWRSFGWRVLEEGERR